MSRIILSITYIAVALGLCIILYAQINFPVDVRSYFRTGFYSQFGAIAIAVELLVAGIYLLLNHKKTNFTMGLFGFTALLDPIFNYFGISSSNVPVYASIIFLCFAGVSLYIAFSNAFDTGKISLVNVVITFTLGVLVELFFNYF